MHGELCSDDLIGLTKTKKVQWSSESDRVVGSPYQCEGAVVDSSNLARQYTTH